MILILFNKLEMLMKNKMEADIKNIPIIQWFSVLQDYGYHQKFLGHIKTSVYKILWEVKNSLN